MNITRRHLLTAGLGGASLLLGGCAWPGARQSPRVVAGARATGGQDLLAALAEDGSIVWLRPRTRRAHGIARCGNDKFAVFDRRPGKSLEILRLSDGALLQRIACAEGAQFNGHGVADKQRPWIWATETQFDVNGNPSGWLSAYSLDAARRVIGVPTGGLAPHQCIQVGDRVLVANGGYREQPDNSDAKQLDPNRPSNLAWLNVSTRTLTGRRQLSDSALSLRHLARAPGGRAIVGAQREPGSSEALPLVFLADATQGLTPLPEPEGGWEQLVGFVGSVACNGTTVLATSPRVGAVVRWQLADQTPGQVTRIADVSSAGFSGVNTVLASGAGLFQYGESTSQHALAFDDHLLVV